ncbi:hypothetical protein [Rhizobium sp. LCM 4573]|uniref:hypothetical protein n=1 Tax=Rhizobium sp. LCM 4573 TaxID=1848291 RepID=UPI0008DAE637|nr:hypothetical protein [Rhizobium sp. LCM 4573]OHV84377.1 hypothetical protein LCM4573_01480 [Rhizobium sp. LCM 4573]
MARQLAGDVEIQAIGELLAAMREAVEQSAAAFAKAADKFRMTNEAMLDAEESRIAEMLKHEREAEARLARFAARLSHILDRSLAAYENRDTPNRYEWYLAILSPSAAHRARETRWRRLSLDHGIETCLADLDMLLGLAGEHRQFLIERRKASEAELNRFIDQRGEALEELLQAEGGDARSGPQAAAVFFRFAGLFQNFIDALNESVGAVNALINKLVIETERALVLRDALRPAANQTMPSSKEAANAWPHIAPLVALSEKGMLSIGEIERRRNLIDQTFHSRFDAHHDKLNSTRAQRPIT